MSEVTSLRRGTPSFLTTIIKLNYPGSWKAARFKLITSSTASAEDKTMSEPAAHKATASALPPELWR